MQYPNSERRIKMPRFTRKTAAGLCFGAMVGLSLLLPTNYLTEDAGPALDVNGKINGVPVVSVKGVKTYPTSTKLYMTTVSAWGSADGGVPGISALAALFSKDRQLIPVRAMYPKELSASQVNTQNLELMRYSQDAAAVVAAQTAGLPVSMDVTVAGTSARFPSGKYLRKGDIICAVGTDAKNMRQVRSHYALTAFLRTVAPRTEIFLRVRRGKDTVTFSFPTLPYSAGGLDPHPGSLLGVEVRMENVKLPVRVKYAVEGIGGPSAGNMFTLGIYDRLTAGSLGGNRRIAGTGTVSWNGDIGPIGGIEHKMRGAARAGARHFLAPAENCPETIGYEPEGMSVWAVRSVDESIAAVKAIAAGDTSGLRTCRQIVRGGHG